MIKKYSGDCRHIFQPLCKVARPILNESHAKHVINRGYYMKVRRYDFYFQVVKTILFLA